MGCIFIFIRPNVALILSRDCAAKDERRGIVKINPTRFNVTMAKLCLTTRDLQKSGGLSRSTIAKVKNDPNYVPNLKTIGKIAKALGVTVEYLTETEECYGL